MRRELPLLTSLRAFAALTVFVFHLPVHVPGQKLGYVGVAFFYVLSGFILTWSYQKGVTGRVFFGRRFARIYPSHLVLWLVVLVFPYVAL